MHLFGGSASVEQNQEDPLSFFTNPAPSSSTPLTDCSNGIGIDEMQRQEKRTIQKQKKRETDRRYRENKNKAVTETNNKLIVTIIENEKLNSTNKKLQQEIIQLIKQLKCRELMLETIYAELRQEIKYLRIENEMTKCLLNDPNTINIISNMIEVLKENEELKRTVKHKEVIIALLAEK